MASIINAISTGAGGLVSSGDASGQLQLQTNSTAALTIDGSQNATFANTVTATSFSGSGVGLTGINSITTLASNVSMGTGTSFTASGLTLTSYKFLLISFVNASSTAASGYLGTINPPVAANALVTLNAASSKWQNQILSLVDQTSSSGLNAASGITTASTSITFYCANAIAAGTYYLYGMK